MTPSTLSALDASILHWQNYANGLGADEGYPSEHNCALCQKFVYNGCMNCPVQLTSRNSYCHSTPYREVTKALRNNNKDYTHPDFITAAKKELDFLISIRNNANQPTHQ